MTRRPARTEPKFGPSHSLLGDEPKSLGNPDVRAARWAMLHQPHVAPLTMLVDELRLERGLTTEIPYFDPLDGGTQAKVLFVLEAPGPKAVASGFVSRNNPDETARNMFLLLREAGLDRGETVLWNIVPWYIGSGKRIRAARSDDIEAGFPHLIKIANRLEKLKGVVLVGRKAGRVREVLAGQLDVPVWESHHPSPLFVNNRPENRGLILTRLREIRARIA